MLEIMERSLVTKSTCSRSRRYRLISLTAWGLYALAVAAISGWFGWEPPKAGIGLYIAAVFPALPVGVAIFAMGRFIVEDPDEFQRMIQVKAVLIGTGLTMFTCTAWGFLAQYAHVWALPLYFVFQVWVAFWLLAVPVIKRNYQ